VTSPADHDAASTRFPAGGPQAGDREPGQSDDLDRHAVEDVDRSGLVRDVEGQAHQLEDALWRVESARIPPGERPGGLTVCGMGGSAIGGDLAVAAIGDRARRPVRTVRGYGLPPEAAAGALVLCASYSGDTEETLACFEAAGAAGAERAALTTGGDLAAAARAEGVPVIGVPGGMQPRAAVAYMVVAALECAALCGAAPSLRTEVESSSRLLGRLSKEWRPDSSRDALSKQLARRLHGTVPVIYGVAATAPVALRWKTQLNENADLPAFSNELPEADHNELNGWLGVPGRAPLAAVLIDDAGADARLRRRIPRTAAAVEPYAAAVAQVAPPGTTRLERMVAGVLLGDFVSVYVAVLRGVDPTSVEAIDRFKRAL
jgi:glucose/mannose-6-phosphate isomerase